VKEAFGAVLPPAQARPALLSHPPYPDRKPDSGDVLGAALQGLPLDQRITFLLAYQMGLSVECIEEITRCPNLVVISRLALARKVVAQVVDAYTSEDDKDHVGARRHRLHLA
jgi:DNA-directed RNA polymerase specialized sigma24 family protein